MLRRDGIDDRFVAVPEADGEYPRKAVDVTAPLVVCER